MRLRFGPHRHVAAVAVPANANSPRINGIFLEQGIDSGHDVAIIAAPEIFHVALCERLALTITHTRVRTEREISNGGFSAHRETVPASAAGGRTIAVYIDHERIFLARIIVFRQQQPTRQTLIPVRPVEVAGGSPGGLDVCVACRDLFPPADWAGPDF